MIIPTVVESKKWMGSYVTPYRKLGEENDEDIINRVCAIS